MKDLADHLFDILENSVTAGATKVIITLGIYNKRFFWKIRNNGQGLKKKDVIDPFVTSRKTRRVGLGLSLLKETAESTNGFLKISSLNDKGVSLEFETDISHIDAKPFGDLSKVFVDAVNCWPNVDFKILIEIEKNKNRYVFDTKKVRSILKEGELQLKEIQDVIYRSINKERSIAMVGKRNAQNQHLADSLRQYLSPSLWCRAKPCAYACPVRIVLLNHWEKYNIFES